MFDDMLYISIAIYYLVVCSKYRFHIFSFLLSGSTMELANLVWYNRIPSVYEQLMSVGDNSMSSLQTGTIDKNYFHSTSLRSQTNKYTRLAFVDLFFHPP